MPPCPDITIFNNKEFNDNLNLFQINNLLSDANLAKLYYNRQTSLPQYTPINMTKNCKPFRLFHQQKSHLANPMFFLYSQLNKRRIRHTKSLINMESNNKNKSFHQKRQQKLSMVETVIERKKLM